MSAIKTQLGLLALSALGIAIYFAFFATDESSVAKAGIFLASFGYLLITGFKILRFTIFGETPSDES